MLEHFGDPELGGFFFTSDDHERLLTRNRSTHDGALPAGAAVAAGWLARLGCHLGDERFRSAARETLIGLRPAVERSPSAFATLLLAAEWEARPDLEIAIVGTPEAPATAALVDRVRRRFLHHVVEDRGGGDSVHIVIAVDHYPPPAADRRDQFLRCGIHSRHERWILQIS